MGIQMSNLNFSKINNILLNDYNIVPKYISEINRGTANIFKVTTNENQYILKEFSENRSVQSIEKELNIINYLATKNINVPQYIKTNNNKYYLENDNRIVISQKFVDGYTMENNSVDNYDKIIESATILGKITKELKDYPELDEGGFIQKNLSKESLNTGIGKMKQLIKNLNSDNPYKDKIRQDLNDKINIAEELLKTFDFNIINKLTVTNAHGDYSIQQLIYNDKKGTTVIDFETAKKLPIVWEVMRSYSYIDKEAKDGNLNIDTLANYFREFCKYVPLNNYDLEYASYIYLLQLSNSVFGYKEYNDDYTQNKLLKFAFFRTNLCRYLYKNSEKISAKLLEINKYI